MLYSLISGYTDLIWHRDSIGSFKADARVVPGSRPRLGLMFTCVCACRQTIESTFAPSWSGIGQVARPTFSGISGRVTELRAVDEGAVPASAPETCWLFVLPVAARRWVSTDNTFLLYLELLAHFTICFSRNMTMWKILNFFDPKLNYDTNFGIYFLVWRF